MSKKVLFVYLFSLSFIFGFVSNSKVYELSDKFIELRKDGGQWLIMFYAPWCGHCKRIEPVWGLVAQSLYKTNIRVGRVDCTRFTSIAHHFKIHGYPTIKFLKDDEEFTYDGDRTRQDFVNFAVRLSGPPVREITNTQDLETLKNSDSIFFMYVSHGDSIEDDQTQPLWMAFESVAKTLQSHAYFYSVSKHLAANYIQLDNIKLPAIFVHKESSHYFFEAFDENNQNLIVEIEKLNTTLHKWINEERFQTFHKITPFNFNELIKTKKYLVIAVVEESKVNEIPPDMLEFRDMVESVINKHRDKYHKQFQFCWTGSTDLANSIAMAFLPLPYLLVLNTTTHYHYIPEDDPSQMTPNSLHLFLESIQNQTAPCYGGNNFFVRLYRAYFEAKSKLSDMWYGNPVLTLLIFGLPLGFLSLICYSICCADILDADEEDEDDGHEKKE